MRKSSNTVEPGRRYCLRVRAAWVARGSVICAVGFLSGESLPGPSLGP
jgi:hypothetical protein